MIDLVTLPRCGANCIVSSLQSSTCPPLDQACLCADKVFGAIVQTCVMANCTIKEALYVQNATWTDCGYHETDQQTVLIATLPLFAGIQLLFVGLRILSRLVKIAPWGWDDTIIVINYAGILAWAGAFAIEFQNGLGKNIWTLSSHQITYFLKVFFIYEVLYSVLIFLVKISIVFLYMRIFPGDKFRIVAWVTQGVLLTSLVVFTLLPFAQCQPISYFWTFWDGEHKGKCFDLPALAYASAAVNITLEVWMLMLPAWLVSNLNMSFKKRVSVMAMFCFGIVTVIISCLRVPALRTFTISKNPTRELFPLAMLSAAELTAGLMVACMPAARLFVLRYCPCIFCGLASTKRTRFTGDSTPPYPPSSTTPRGRPKKPKSLKLLKESHSLQTFVPEQSLSPKDLDKYRNYAMHVSISSPGIFSLSDSSRQASPMRNHDLPDPPGSARTVAPPAEYMSVPDRWLEEEGLIYVKHDFEVIHSKAPSPLDDAAGEDPSEMGKERE